MRKDLKFCFGSISVRSLRCCGYRNVVWHSSLPGCKDGAPYACRLRPTACCSLRVRFTNSSGRCQPLLSSAAATAIYLVLLCGVSSVLMANPPVGQLISWRQHIPPKHRYVPTRVHGVTLHVTAVFCWTFYSEDPRCRIAWGTSRWKLVVSSFVIALADCCSYRKVAYCFLWKNNRHRCTH